MFSSLTTAQHTDIKALRVIQLVFLPKNTTAVLQTMDMGVTENLKTLNRHHIVEWMLLCPDNEETSLAV